MARGGEAEDSARPMPVCKFNTMFFGIMVLIVLVLFNSSRRLCYLVTVPLAVIE